ncbi:anti sigma factor C-terminal domain-containing protein [Brevibacillus sp. B_LB10_24]|uniref:anti sigma factor C-terminal domain-containing protein n=1 Tax=Brevibacillus sp. B_LB10_24 TaxID=3380645 RepID=UPI0038B75BDD
MANDQERSLDQLLLAYLQGQLSEEDSQALRVKLENDQTYAKRLEDLMFENWLHASQEEEKELSEAQQARILKRSKWRSRLAQSVFTTGGIVAIGFCLFIVSQVFNYLWFWPASEDLHRVMKDVVSFTNPGMRAGSGGTSGGLFFSMEMKYTLEEQVGHESKAVGLAENDVLFTRPDLKYNWNNGFYKESLYFRYPSQEHTGQADTLVSTAGWRTLEKLPEGTVSQLAVSFTRPLTHDEYFEVIGNYDVETTWLAVDTGQEAHYAGSTIGRGTVWGYSPNELDYGGSIQVNGEGERRAKTLIAELEFLQSRQKWAEPMLKRSLYDREAKLDERIGYLQKNGVHLYGAVITGPTKELLKLQKEPLITEPFVGQTDWWNWDQPGASGRAYSW